MDKNMIVSLGVVLIVLAVFYIFLKKPESLPSASGSSTVSDSETVPAPAPTPTPAPARRSPTGLLIEVLAEGSGEAVRTGQRAVVHYTGRLSDGMKFDSSLDRGKPFVFTLGEMGVIAGWEEGVLGMRVGEKRRLTIPPELGYGAAGSPGAIPPNATLLFEVELVGIE